MPSARRVKLVFFTALSGFVILLFYTSHLRHTTAADTRTAGDFYRKTADAMDRVRGGGSVRQKPIPKYDDGDDAAVANAMAERLRLAELKAKENANAKAPNKPDAPEDVIGVGSSAGGQLKLKEDKELVRDSEEDPEVKAEINSILKKSPIIIFSKSYCPHSKRAKGILLEKYNIQPAPYVVELDEHPLGKKIQDRLAEMTGRKTVPNVLIAGISVGGGDEIAELDREKKLGDKIKEIGGKRIEVNERFIASKKAG
ncbi:putative glutaredoxin [Podospora aff. communis PSN243]|uniref:Glutaredoxin n=1 Tax=Podospora aff. communis PSN243 TaxID=3040156 RepID=A0AAV9GV61_9PEZI|nr:putative glutaredoxin [Podospora aff. communis PSN243]